MDTETLGHTAGMNRSRRLPPHIEGRPFSTAEGSGAGLSKKRMRASDLTRPYPATRTPRGDRHSVDLLIHAYAHRMSKSDFFSHVTAARVHRLPLSFAVERNQTIDVSTEAPALRDRVRGIRGHHVAPKTITVVEVQGLRATSAVDTWCQLSTMLGLDDLIRIGDALVRRRHPFAVMGDLLAAVRRYSGTGASSCCVRRSSGFDRASIHRARPTCGCSSCGPACPSPKSMA